MLAPGPMGQAHITRIPNLLRVLLLLVTKHTAQLVRPSSEAVNDGPRADQHWDWRANQVVPNDLPHEYSTLAPGAIRTVAYIVGPNLNPSHDPTRR